MQLNVHCINLENFHVLLRSSDAPEVEGQQPKNETERQANMEVMKTDNLKFPK